MHKDLKSLITILGVILSASTVVGRLYVLEESRSRTDALLEKLTQTLEAQNTRLWRLEAQLELLTQQVRTTGVHR